MGPGQSIVTDNGPSSNPWQSLIYGRPARSYTGGTLQAQVTFGETGLRMEHAVLYMTPKHRQHREYSQGLVKRYGELPCGNMALTWKTLLRLTFAPP